MHERRDVPRHDECQLKQTLLTVIRGRKRSRRNRRRSD